LRAGARRRFLDGFEIHAYSQKLEQLHATLLGRPVEIARVNRPTN